MIRRVGIAGGDAILQIDDTFVAEAGHQLAGLGIDLDQFAVAGSGED